MANIIYKTFGVKKLITIDKDIVWGTPVFKGTRVPIQHLFDYMQCGYPLESFYKDFPSVSEKQAQSAIAIAGTVMTSYKLAKLYETITRRKPSRKPKRKLKTTLR